MKTGGSWSAGAPDLRGPIQRLALGVGIFRTPGADTATAHDSKRVNDRLKESLQFVSTPVMDVQMRPVGHWGPVTATLDWCEVRHYYMHTQIRMHLTTSPFIIMIRTNEPSRSSFHRPIISFLIMWPKCPTRSPIFSSSAYRFMVLVCHGGNLYPLAIS
jgi:hypothetical protein